MMLKILIVDDHAIVRVGVSDILRDGFGSLDLGEAGNANEALELAKRKTWDVVLLDVTMPGKGGLEALRELKAAKPEMPVLMLSMHPADQLAPRFLKAGASGYLNKDAAATELVGAVRKVSEGGRYVSDLVAEKLVTELQGRGTKMPHDALTDREFEIMCMIAAGNPVQDIAKHLELRSKTVSTYRARILGKMRMKSNSELVRYAMHHQILM